MTDDEKRKQKAMLLLEHEETRLDVEHLKTQAYYFAERLRAVVEYLGLWQEPTPIEYRIIEVTRKIDDPEVHNLVAWERVEDVVTKLKAGHAKLKQLEAQKKAPGMGT